MFSSIVYFWAAELFSRRNASFCSNERSVYVVYVRDEHRCVTYYGQMDRPIRRGQADLCGCAFDDGWSRALNHLFINAQVIGKGFILSILGIGYGLGNVAPQATMLETSPSNMVGTTSGLFQTCRYLGSILSSVILGLLLERKSRRPF